MSSHRIAALALATALAGQLPSSTPLTVDIDIDATTAEGRISPLLYGQFIEFMLSGSFQTSQPSTRGSLPNAETTPLT